MTCERGAGAGGLCRCPPACARAPAPARACSSSCGIDARAVARHAGCWHACERAGRTLPLRTRCARVPAEWCRQGRAWEGQEVREDERKQERGMWVRGGGGAGRAARPRLGQAPARRVPAGGVLF